MRNDPDTVMIFAAGLGTRMGALTKARPKPLIEVGGRALIDYALGYVRAAGIDRIVVNLHYQSAMLSAHLAGAGVSFSHEAERLLDTGGGLRHALPLLGSAAVFTLNSDAVFAGPNPLSALSARWEPAKMDALLLLCPPERAVGHDLTSGFRLDGENRLSRAPEMAYTGVQIIKTDRLDEISDRVFSLNRLWDMMVDDGKLFGAVYPGKWCDVGHREGIRLAEALLEERDV